MRPIFKDGLYKYEKRDSRRVSRPRLPQRIPPEMEGDGRCVLEAEAGANSGKRCAHACDPTLDTPHVKRAVASLSARGLEFAPSRSKVDCAKICLIIVA